MTKENGTAGKEVVVANVTRRGPCNSFDFEAKVFASIKRAEKWIDEQIDSLVAEYGLDRDKAVEDWHVDIDANSSIQFDTEEQLVC